MGIPSKIVIIIPCTLSSHFPTKIESWPQVREIPLLNKTTVFNKGTENADKGVMHIGGQTPPVSNLFLNEKEKNLQKKREKEENLSGNKPPYRSFKRALCFISVIS